jgi:hypothetical protein
MGHNHDSERHRLLSDALRGALPALEGQALALFGWFGSGTGPWNGYPSYESWTPAAVFAWGEFTTHPRGRCG